MSPLVALFGGYYAVAATASEYERQWISSLVFPLVLWLFFFDILCAPLIAAHEALVRFSADIVSIGVITTSPTHSCESIIRCWIRAFADCGLIIIFIPAL